VTVRRGALLLALLGLAFLLLAPPAGAQCAMCKTALTNSPEGRALSGEFNKAILVMLFAPYLIFGSFTLVFLRERIQARLGRFLSGLRLPRTSR
jgi:hypothetical protein